MSAEAAKTYKQSFFKEYFNYKLRSLKGFNIAFLVMNLIMTVCLSILVLVLCIQYKNYTLDWFNFYWDTAILSWFIMAGLYLVFIAENALIIIMAAVNMKFCHERSIIDTVGGLPLTVKQRFFGDFLSGFTSFAGSFIFGCIPSFIIMAVIQFGISPGLQAAQIARGKSQIYIAPDFQDNFLLLGFLAVTTMFLCLAASYTIACFVTSCSGKLGNSIIFSFIAAISLPAIMGAYSTFTVMSSVGVADDTFARMIGYLPPAGTIFHLFYSFTHDLWIRYIFPSSTPGVIVMLLIVILPAAGAYLITKKRKAEKVEKPFVFKFLYSAATFLLCITLGGLALISYELPAFVLPLAVFAFAACLFIEFTESHSVKTLWKGAVRFAVSAAVCIVFGLAAYGSQGFELGEKLPNEKNIIAVGFSGTYFEQAGLHYEQFDDPAIISAVLSENNKIIENIDKFSRIESSANIHSYKRLHIHYILKNGVELERTYNAINPGTDEIIKNFCDNILNRPEVYNRTTLGILGKPCSGIDYESGIGSSGETFVIKPSQQDEFIERLKNDLINRPKDFDHSDHYENRTITYSYTDDSGKIEEERIYIYDFDKNTLEFLDNSDNFSGKETITIEVNDTDYYRVEYYIDGVKPYTSPALYAGFNIRSDAERKLASYFETDYTYDDSIYSDKFDVRVNSRILKIKKENEQAALAALTALIKEKISGGNR